ncbi:alpha/beta fold hydrolase [Roseixanthobacter liquoris]|uniref:hypothetical protein n=1 Tax=Roseixanthobacter liquoris TaxID=3119921 RepID=UPI00372778B2
MDMESGHVIWERHSPDRLAIVFAYIDLPVGIPAHHNFLAGSDCSRLYLNPGRNDWYQNGIPTFSDSFDATVTAISTAASTYKEIVCVGHSMGAYAAISFGLSIKAARVLAFGPEIVLRKPGSYSHHYLKDGDVKRGDIRDLLAANTTTSINVVAGRQEAVDMAAAAEILTFPLTHVYPVNSSHATTLHLRDTGQLTPLLHCFIRGDDLTSVLDS